MSDFVPNIIVLFFKYSLFLQYLLNKARLLVLINNHILSKVKKKKKKKLCTDSKCVGKYKREKQNGKQRSDPECERRSGK